MPYKVMRGKKRLFRETFRTKKAAQIAILDAVVGASVRRRKAPGTTLRTIKSYSKSKIVRVRR